MPPRAGPPEVLVRVTPRLLSDALCAVLRQAGLRVAACPVVDRRTTRRSARRFDLAVVSSELPADAVCDRVIRIDDEGEIILPGGAPPAVAGVAGLLLELERSLDEPAAGGAAATS